MLECGEIALALSRADSPFHLKSMLREVLIKLMVFRMAITRSIGFTALVRTMYPVTNPTQRT